MSITICHYLAHLNYYYTLLTELYKVYAAVQLTDSYREIQLKQNLSVDIKNIINDT